MLKRSRKKPFDSRYWARLLVAGQCVEKLNKKMVYHSKLSETNELDFYGQDKAG